MSNVNDTEAVTQRLLEEAVNIKAGVNPDLDTHSLIAVASEPTTETNVIQVIEDFNWNADIKQLDVALASRADVGVREHYAWHTQPFVVLAYVSNPAVPAEGLKLVQAELDDENYYEDFSVEEKTAIRQVLQERLGK